MTGTCCCAEESAEKPVRRRASRWFDAVGWLVPAMALALTPKCPMCVAAYVALFTGVGISLPVAAALRIALVALAAAALAFMFVKKVSRAIARGAPKAACEIPQ